MIGLIHNGPMMRVVPGGHANPTFETRIHHFTMAPLGPRLIESPDSRMVVACAPWAERKVLAHYVEGLRCAAYVLAGASYPEGVVARVYIGETGNWRRRLSEHAGDANKSFTTHVFVLGSFDPRFDKIDALLLQHSLNACAEEQDRAHIVRGAKPMLPRVDRLRALASQADFEDVQRLLATTGCTILEPRVGSQIIPHGETDAPTEFPRRARANGYIRENSVRVGWNDRDHQRAVNTPPVNAEPAARNEERARHQAPAIYVLEHAGLIAFGYQHGAEFVVLPGSHMRREVMPSFEADVQNMQRRNDLIQANAISEVRGHDDRWRLRFERRLPSAPIAAKVLMGVNLKADAWRPVAADPHAA